MCKQVYAWSLAYAQPYTDEQPSRFNWVTHTHADENSCGYHALYNSIYLLKVINATSDTQVHGDADTDNSTYTNTSYQPERLLKRKK